MALASPRELSRYLLSGQLSRRGCLRPRTALDALRASSAGGGVLSQPERLVRPLHAAGDASSASSLDTSSPPAPHRLPEGVPLRKRLKDEAKALRASGNRPRPYAERQAVPGWELTVGIEIHAQLNTFRKLFSAASNSFDTKPNSHVAPFDVAIPGSQPVFQPETLIPAVRAALALGCDVQRVSRWDRKHYVHWDQPSGYQITQYYEPFARDGSITLHARDGIAEQDG